MKLFLTGLFIVSSLCLAGCAGDSEADEVTKADTAAATLGVPGATEGEKTFIGAYLSLKDALVKSDAQAAKKSAEVLKQLIPATQTSGNDLQTSINAIASSDDLEEATSAILHIVQCDDRLSSKPAAIPGEEPSMFSIARWHSTLPAPIGLVMSATFAIPTSVTKCLPADL